MNNRQKSQSEVPAPAELHNEAEVEVAAVPAPAEVEAKAPSKKIGKINVVATRAGFFKGSRKVEGDKFTVDSDKELGSWMKII